MVKIGFIVEGDTEKIVIESRYFRNWAQQHGIQVFDPVIDAKGGGNLLPHYIAIMVEQLQQADHIVILTDLDNASDSDAVRHRICRPNTPQYPIFVAVKAIEAWFLADSHALGAWLGLEDIREEYPEHTPGMPWDRLKVLAADLGKRGPGSSKVVFAKKMVEKYRFSLERAAHHPHCPSAKSFYDGLLGLADPSGLGLHRLTKPAPEQP